MVNLKLVCRSARDVAIETNFCWILFRELHKICISAVLSTELVRWTQAASGADGRVNVGLCAASSLSRKRFVLSSLNNLESGGDWRARRNGGRRASDRTTLTTYKSIFLKTKIPIN